MKKEKMKKWGPSLICLTNICVITSALAVPVWRTDPPGQKPTTYQMWTFNTDSNPAAPETDLNPYGPASAAIVGQPDYTFGWYQTYDARDGVWHAEFLEISLEIPNRQVPDLYKEIWITVGYEGDIDRASISPVPPGTAVIILGQTVTKKENYWKELLIGWRIEPNPDWEIFCLGFSGTGGSIDYVVVETICIPEPATVTLLGLSAALLLLLKTSNKKKTLAFEQTLS